MNVVDFCNKLSKSEGLESAYTINGDNVSNWSAKVGLPTEAEWEFSANNQNFKYAGKTVDEVTDATVVGRLIQLV